MSDFMVKTETLISVLCEMLDVVIIHADYQAIELQGGTLADVRLIKGIAETIDGGKLPYEIVLKTQQKWERPGDPDSWRREYDLYVSDLGAVFSDSFRWPKCYHAEMSGDEIQIWMEYIDGASGDDLTIEMLEHAAFELGRFQSRLFCQPQIMQNLSNFSDTGFLKRDYEQWHIQKYDYEALISDDCPLSDSQKQALKDNKIQLCDGKSFEYSFLRSGECTIPQHLKQMIINIDDDMDSLFNEISNLPVVLCHRDFWIENIIYNDGKIRLIDWDTAGWGYLGEDLASLIADEIDFDNFEDYCQKLIPAYYEGISEQMDISIIDKNFIHKMVLIKFGYRMVQEYLFSETDDEREEQIQALQKIYEMK